MSGETHDLSDILSCTSTSATGDLVEIKSDGTAQGTSVSHGGNMIGYITNLEIEAKPDQPVVAHLTVTNPNLDIHTLGTIKTPVPVEILSFVRDTLLKECRDCADGSACENVNCRIRKSLEMLNKLTVEKEPLEIKLIESDNDTDLGFNTRGESPIIGAARDVLGQDYWQIKFTII